jgi:hypothetical protein
MKVTVGFKNAQATEEICGSNMVAEGMMEVRTPYSTSTPVVNPAINNSKAVK